MRLDHSPIGVAGVGEHGGRACLTVDEVDVAAFVERIEDVSWIGVGSKACDDCARAVARALEGCRDVGR